MSIAEDIQMLDRSWSWALPRPTLTLANVLGTVAALARDFNDLLGAKVIRKRTFVRKLDVEARWASPTGELSSARCWPRY